MIDFLVKIKENVTKSPKKRYSKNELINILQSLINYNKAENEQKKIIIVD